MMVPAPEVHGPLLELVDRVDEATPGRPVAIIVPELVQRRWWPRFLHGRRAARIRAALMEHAGPRLMVASSPWRA